MELLGSGLEKRESNLRVPPSHLTELVHAKYDGSMTPVELDSPTALLPGSMSTSVDAGRGSPSMVVLKNCPSTGGCPCDCE